MKRGDQIVQPDNIQPDNTQPDNIHLIIRPRIITYTLFSRVNNELVLINHNSSKPLSNL